MNPKTLPNSGASKFNDRQDSPSSDEKMDTGSESFMSKQGTPSSIASDFGDNEPEVLPAGLQSPEQPVLRLTRNLDLNNSLITKMSSLRLDSLDIQDKPKSLPITPKLSSLTTATDHPLMGLGSPDSVENYPDLIPKKLKEDLSLSSIEDDKNELNLNSLYGPQRNTSKNNLYFSEHFTTADSTIDTSDLKSPPDITKTNKERRKIYIKDSSTPISKGPDDEVDPPRTQGGTLEVPRPEEYHTGITEWCESPSQLRSIPNFELPIEMCSNMSLQDDDPGTPDLLSSSTQEDKSLYKATVDPCSGRAALRHKTSTAPAVDRPRRKVAVPQFDDTCSLDSVSCLSSDDDDEQLELEKDEGPSPAKVDDDENEDRVNSISEASDPIPEYSAAEEFEEERAWLKVPLADGTTSTCDMKVIEPYKRVLSHGGYTAGGCAILVLSACHLPPSSRPDYNYVMTHLFLYVLWSVERLVTEQYALVYLGGAARRTLPTWRWLHECYAMVDRRLRKNLKHLYLVHPTFWLKSIVILCKPFVSSKFFRKISYVKNLQELMKQVPVEPNAIPDVVKEYDATL